MSCLADRPRTGPAFAAPLGEWPTAAYDSPGQGTWHTDGAPLLANRTKHGTRAAPVFLTRLVRMMKHDNQTERRSRIRSINTR